MNFQGSRSMVANVVVVSNQRLFRDALGLLLLRPHQFRVITELGQTKVVADVAVVDSLALRSNENVLSDYRKQLGEAPILIITSPYDSTPIERFLEVGVAGILDWSASAEYLCDALKRILSGETVIAVSLGDRSFKPEGNSQVRNLSRRELQVIREVSLGKSNTEIAHALGVTENTVKGHMVNIFEKLDVNNRVRVATYAFENGLLRSSAGTSGGSNLRVA